MADKSEKKADKETKPAKDKPKAVVQFTDAKESKWPDILYKSASGMPKPILANVLIALREAPVWKGAFRYNAFSLIVEIIKPPPWVKGAERDDWQPRPWTDHDDNMLCEWLQRRAVLVDTHIAARAAYTVAKETTYHPVQEYLAGLHWDGVRRLEKWLSAYVGAENTPYHAAIGVRWMISLVARASEHDVKADCVLVLQGAQGTLKSTLLKTLSPNPKWFTDEVRRFGTKDAAMGLSGRWIVELAELSALNEVTLEAMKAFLSQTMDRYRPPYGRYVTDNVRQCVFAATTNKDSFLRDETGDRRFWPVRCGNIDLERIKRDRGQLWAEAQELYKAGHPWWLETPELRALAERAQAERFEEDPWEALVANAIKGLKQATIEWVMGRALQIIPQEATKGQRARVANILTHAGWEKTAEKNERGERIWRLRA